MKKSIFQSEELNTLNNAELKNIKGGDGADNTDNTTDETFVINADGSRTYLSLTRNASPKC